MQPTAAPLLDECILMSFGAVAAVAAVALAAAPHPVVAYQADRAGGESSTAKLKGCFWAL